MSYLKELQGHYKAVRARLHAPKQNLVFIPLRITHASSMAAQKSGLLPEGANEQIVSDALSQSRPDRIGNVHSQAVKLAEELMNAPKLPPLPGLDLQQNGQARWMHVLRAVAKHHNLRPDDIIGKSRKKHIVSARFEVFYRLRFDLGYSYPKIGYLMKRDHSSVLHGVHKVKTNLLDLLKRNADHVASFAGNHLTAGETHCGQSVASPN